MTATSIVDPQSSADAGQTAVAHARQSSLRTIAIAVPTAFFILFFAGPLLYVVLLSFWRVENFIVVPTFSFDNYLDFANNLTKGSNYGLAILQTLYVALTTAVVATLVSFPMAYAIAHAVPERWQRLIVVLAVAPFWTSYILRVYAWQVLLAKRGVINSLLAYVGVDSVRVDILYTQTATRVGLLHFLVPILVVILYVAIRNIDPTLLEASRQMGATRRQTFVRVVLPLARQGIILSLSFATLVACGDVLSPSILGGGTGESILGKLPLFANMIIRAYVSSTNLPHTSALAIILVLITLVLLLIGFLIAERTRVPTT